MERGGGGGGDRGGLASTTPPARPPEPAAGATSGRAAGGKEGCSAALLTLVRQLVELRHLERAAPLFQRLPAPVHCGAETGCEGGSNEELAARGACSRQAAPAPPEPAPEGGPPGLGCSSTRGRAATRAGEAAPRGPGGPSAGGAAPARIARSPALAPGARPALRLRELQAVFVSWGGAGGRPGRAGG